jgi:hypothetical protein
VAQKGGGLGRPGTGGREFPAIQELVRQLALTDEQKTQIRGFLTDAHSEIQAVRQDDSLTREQRQERLAQIEQRTQQNVRSILSVEQQMKADELKQRAEQRFAERREKFAENALEGLTKRLELSEAQRSTIQSYMDQQKDQVDALRNNAALSREQKREQAENIRRQTRENIRATLTPEQQQQLEQLREQARQRFDNRRGRRFRGGPRPQRGGSGAGVNL